jgi:hypothetical protein
VSYQIKVGTQFFPELLVLHFYSITIAEAASEGNKTGEF